MNRLNWVCTVCLALLMTSCSGPSYSPEFEDQVLSENQVLRLQEGIALFDQGEQEKALDEFVILLDEVPDNALVLYEAALTANELGQYETSIDYATKGLRIRSSVRHQLFHVAGVSSHLSGNHKKATAFLEAGLAERTDYYPLFYSLGIVQFDEGSLEEAAASFTSVLELDSGHVGSHRLLGMSHILLGDRFAPIMALSYYLLLDTNSPQAREAAMSLQSVLGNSGGLNASGNADITLSLASMKGDGPTSSIELVIGLTTIRSFVSEYAGEETIESLARQYEIIFESVAKLVNDKNTDGIFWDVYAPYFAGIHNTDQSEAFAYRIFGLIDKLETGRWKRNNQEKVDRLESWLTSHNLTEYVDHR